MKNKKVFGVPFSPEQCIERAIANEKEAERLARPDRDRHCHQWAAESKQRAIDWRALAAQGGNEAYRAQLEPVMEQESD